MRRNITEYVFIRVELSLAPSFCFEFSQFVRLNSPRPRLGPPSFGVSIFFCSPAFVDSEQVAAANSRLP